MGKEHTKINGQYKWRNKNSIKTIKMPEIGALG